MLTAVAAIATAAGPFGSFLYSRRAGPGDAPLLIPTVDAFPLWIPHQPPRSQGRVTSRRLRRLYVTRKCVRLPAFSAGIGHKQHCRLASLAHGVQGGISRSGQREHIMARRVMLVDDNKDLVLILKRYLEAEGYEIIPAYDGPEALELVLTERPDVIVLDVYMPQMNGKDVLIRLKQDPATAHIPVIMQTAATELVDFEDTAVAGADAHLPKPCDPPDLLLMIERLLKATDDGNRAEAAGAAPADVQ